MIHASLTPKEKRMASKTGKGRTFWTPLVAEFEQTSGLTQAGFAKAKGVHPGTLGKWIYKLRDERTKAASSLPVRFVEVEAPPPIPAQQIKLEVGAVLLHLDRVPEPGWLAELVHQIRGGSPC
jgi:transposase-like protein